MGGREEGDRERDGEGLEADAELREGCGHGTERGQDNIRDPEQSTPGDAAGPRPQGSVLRNSGQEAGGWRDRHGPSMQLQLGLGAPGAPTDDGGRAVWDNHL